MAHNLSLIVAGAALLTCLGGCATVAVYEPTSSVEVDLAGPGADLQRASRTYCETARNRGLATGEASLKGLAESVFGSGSAAEPYWVRMGAESRPPAQAIRILRADIADMAGGLASLNAQASSLLRTARATRDDVAEFERVLIHARQGRDSLSLAAAKLAPRLDAPLSSDAELVDLDRALLRAHGLADELAASRTAEPLAQVASTPGRV